MKTKLLKLLAVMTISITALLALGITASAETVGAFEVTGGTNGTDYTYENGVLTINTSTALTIKNTNPSTSTTDRIEVADGVSANITLNGVNIDTSNASGAAFVIADNSTGNVTITLADGTTNTLKSVVNCAGLQKNGEYSETLGKLTITGTGSLTATGGDQGAGVGGGFSSGSNITISGGTITAIGGEDGAGIGGGFEGSGSNIKISGGVVTATGGDYGAGIGGGWYNSGSNIEISGGEVIATSGEGGAVIGGAGIGGGKSGSGSNIEISGGTVTATGDKGGAGIGGGETGSGSYITISGGTVTAESGAGGAGIGGGNRGSADNITISGGTVKADTIGCTPTDGTANATPVYLLELDVDGTSAVTINGKAYPTKHIDENKLYVYLPAKTAQAPNEVTIGSTTTKYTYDTTNSKWLTVVDAPEADINKFTCNGVELTYTLAESDYYTISGNKQTNAGTYTVTVSLKENTVWSDGTTDDKEYPFTITYTDADNNGICDDCNAFAEPEFTNGYYQITNAGNLMWFVSQVNEGRTAINAELTADIAMNGIDWTMMSSFAGTFDGNGYTISGLNGHKADTADTHGFIRTLADGGVVKNLTFTEADIWNHEGPGAISAVIVYTNNGTVENCVVKESVIQHGNYDALGVVVGVNGGTIRNCASISNTMTRRFSSAKDICGFVWSNSGSIENCFNYDCTYQNGSNRYAFTQSNTGTITNCYYYESSETISDTVVTAKTADQFAGGEVAYLLQSTQTADEETGIVPHVWGQTLTGENKQTCPVLGGAKVYYGYTACNSTEKSYSNSEIGNEKPQHIFEEDSNGFCTVCGAYEQPETDEKGVYQISNAGKLYWFAEYVNAGNTSANAVLTADIVVNSGKVAECNGTKGAGWKDWTPIGNYLNKYKGTFEGNNKTISGLYFNDTTVNYVGLFGYIGSNAKIKNVGVVNSYFKGKGYVGGVCGYIGNSTIITNCYNKGSVSGGDSVGGVCGRNFEGTITNCYNTGSVDGNEDVGGVCGYNNSGTITNCYNTGSVTATGDSAYVGGVCGYNHSGTITRCYYDNTVYTGNAVRKNVGGTVGADVLGKSTAEFNSGEVAYLLNGSTSENVTWYQTLETDTYPVLDSKHGIVYSVFMCDGETPAGYSNVNEPVHVYTHTVVPPTYYEQGYTLHECVGKDDSYVDSYTDKLVLPAVSDFATSDASADSISLSWNENSDASGYIIEQYVDGEWVQVADITDNATTEYVVNGLTAATEYQFRIKAYITDGESIAYSEYSDSVSAVTKLSAVSDFAICGTSVDSISLLWNENSDASGYIIEQYVDGEWVQVADITDNATTEYVVNGLTAATEYQFRIKAYITDGESIAYSEYSDSISVVTALPAISGFTSPSKATTAIRLNWTADATVCGYIIEQMIDGYWVQIADITDNVAATYKVTGLTPGTEYSFRMFAYTDDNSTDYTEELTISTMMTAVKGFTSPSRATTAIRLNWSENAYATGYVIDQYTNNGWIQIADITDSEITTYKVTGLKSGTAYKFRIRAYSVTETGETIYGNNNIATLTVNTLSATVKGFDLKSRSSVALRLKWTKNTAVDGYIIEQMIDGVWTEIADIDSYATTEYKVTGLEASTSYSFRMKSYSITKYGDRTYSTYTSVLDKTTNPSAVSSFRVKSRSDRAIRLAWRANASAGGYLIEQYIDGNWVQIADVADGSVTEYKVTGLASATEYQFRVRSYNMDGETALYSEYKTVSGVTL